MPGTIFGIALSQQITANGRPMSGCLLYLYEANTTTPATAFQDYGLTTGLELPNPIEADANGRIPQFWLADGSYRARLTDSSGVVQFDLPSVVALGPSSGSGGGGGVDANAIHQTGDFIWRPTSGARAGWVRANGRTIGSATSSATERANADCENLFLELWNSYSDTLCPVTGGRGANAAADWGANKRIATLNMQGLGAIGLAAMGGTDNGTLDDATFSVGDKTTAASLCGVVVNTLAQADLPDVTPTISVTDTHTHMVVVNSSSTDNADATKSLAVTKGGSYTLSGIASTPTIAPTSGTTAGSITAASTSINGGVTQTDVDNMQPSRTGTWYVRL